jgi:putative membrane protein
MLVNALFRPDAKKRVTAAVRDIEALTSAEVVVSVAPTSARYRRVPWVGGTIAGFAMLLLVLFHPAEVRLAAIPVDVVLAFVAGAVLSSRVAPVRRLVCGGGVMKEAVRRAARTMFVDRRLTRTKGRTAVLVYVSVFERGVDVVCDVGVEDAVPPASWRSAVERISAAVAASGSGELDAFVGAVRALGPILEKALPRRADDENELPDEPAGAGEA